MNKLLCLVYGVSCLLAVVHASSIVYRQKRGADYHKKMMCLGKEIDLSECFKGWSECAKELAPEDMKVFEAADTTEEKKKEIGQKLHTNQCIAVCQWTKHRHLVSADGSVNQTAIDASIDHIYPEGARAGLKSGMAKCSKENPNAFKNDNNCAAHKGFEECIGKSYMEVCKIQHAPPSDPTE